MKKRILAIILLGVMALQLTACSLFGCKADDCSERDIYDDGYCRYHYYEHVGINFINDFSE